MTGLFESDHADYRGVVVSALARIVQPGYVS